MDSFENMKEETEVKESGSEKWHILDPAAQRKYEELMGDSESDEAEEEKTFPYIEMDEPPLSDDNGDTEEDVGEDSNDSAESEETNQEDSDGYAELMGDMEDASDAPIANKMPAENSDWKEKTSEKQPWSGDLENLPNPPILHMNAEDMENTDTANDAVEEQGEKDDNGNVYKTSDGKLLPNNEYTINGITYTTDEFGRKTSYDGKLTSTVDGERDLKEQKEAGGEDRHEKDDGGHLIARVFGGSAGIENLVAMRGRINKSDYGNMEDQIKKALDDHKEVNIHGNVKYEGESQRPSKITVELEIDGKKTIYQFDNNENSTELLDSVKNLVSEDFYERLSNEIDDARADGHDVSITSVKTEYDEDGNIKEVTVIVFDETTERRKNKPTYTREGD